MRTLIAIPCGDMCYTDFLRSLLGMEIIGDVQFTFAQGSLVYDARNNLANIAIDGGFDRVLWLDSDMVFGADLMRNLSADLDEGRELVSGIYYSRKRPIHPVIYDKVYMDASGIPHAETIKDWPEGVFEIAACGFGAVMCTTDLLRRVRERFHLPFAPAYGFGEDLSLCLRVTELGEKMYCDPRISVGHVGLAVYTEDAYRIETR